MREYEMDDIQRANAQAGKFFFSEGAKRFFRSRIGNGEIDV